jgi:putative ABC transport system substrate-binding protein
MKKKFTLLTLCCMLLALCLSAEAQQAKKTPRIGLLWPGSSSRLTASARFDAFRQGLRELGYVDGKNIVIEYRLAEGKPDRLPELATELVNLKVDLIVTSSNAAAMAAKQATATIPIVMAVSSEAVETGIVASLAQPGGNVTGMTSYPAQVTGKRLELLKESFPKISKVAVLGDPTIKLHELNWQELKAVGKFLAVRLQSLEVRSPNPDFKSAFAEATKERADGLLTLPSFLMFSHRKEIVALVAKNRLPAMFHQRDFVDDGGLMSYSANEIDFFRRAAVFVDKILKGVKPADLPVELPKTFELIINLKAAKQIGLTIPPNVLVRADKVIK